MSTSNATVFGHARAIGDSSCAAWHNATYAVLELVSVLVVNELAHGLAEIQVR